MKTITLILLFNIFFVFGIWTGKNIFPKKVEMLVSERLEKCKENNGRYNIFWKEDREEVIYYDTCKTVEKNIDLSNKKL